MKCMFCMFAEDIGILPNKVFTKTLETAQRSPEIFLDRAADLFEKMRIGGHYGVEAIPWFNGSLFDESPPLELSKDDLKALYEAAQKDWSQVEPAVLGTLFERSLDPSKRSQIGAHYTSRDDILRIVEPVILEPLRSEWEDVKVAIEAQVERRRKATTDATKKKARRETDRILDDFMHRLGAIKILDPACGSGNFLYVAIQSLLDLQREVSNWISLCENSSYFKEFLWI